MIELIEMVEKNILISIKYLFEVCARDTEYKGGGGRREAWWRQEATEKQLRTTLTDSREAKERNTSGDMVMQYEPEPEGRRITGWVFGIMGRR